VEKVPAPQAQPGSAQQPDQPKQPVTTALSDPQAQFAPQQQHSAHSVQMEK
jgi:hypothetical protein